MCMFTYTYIYVDTCVHVGTYATAAPPREPTAGPQRKLLVLTTLAHSWAEQLTRAS